MLKEAFAILLERLLPAIRAGYGERLVAVAVYGSVARGVMRPDSDVDLLIVARDLPHGRLKRMKEFAAVEEALTDTFLALRSQGIDTTLSPVLKTPDEVLAGSPLFLDMVEDAQLLFDQNDFLNQQLAKLRRRLAELGAKRIWRGNAWFWDLKPDYKPGEVIEL